MDRWRKEETSGHRISGQIHPESQGTYPLIRSLVEAAFAGAQVGRQQPTHPLVPAWTAAQTATVSSASHPVGYKITARLFFLTYVWNKQKTATQGKAGLSVCASIAGGFHTLWPQQREVWLVSLLLGHLSTEQRNLSKQPPAVVRGIGRCPVTCLELAQALRSTVQCLYQLGSFGGARCGGPLGTGQGSRVGCYGQATSTARRPT